MIISRLRGCEKGGGPSSAGAWIPASSACPKASGDGLREGVAIRAAG